MITEQLMRPGRFDVRFYDNAPFRIWKAVNTLDHIVVTPVSLGDPKQFTDASILAAAVYSGVVTGKPDAKTITGQGLAYWLGTDDGRGSIIEIPVTVTGANLSSVITAVRPASIGNGTITTAGTTNLTYTFQYVTPREAIDFACRAMGAEWRINPNATLDAAVRSTLFVNTPTTVITRWPAGRDGARAYQGIEATRIVVAEDIDGYTTKAIVVGSRGDGARVATGTASAGSVTKKDFNNNTVVFERLVDSPDTPNANLSNFATNVLAMYPASRQHLTLSSDTYAVPVYTKPGDNVYVFDPDANLTDTSRQLRWRGEVIAPVQLRCKEYTWPLQRGMGVYLRQSGATPTYTDLTDYVQWEDGEATEWVVGSGYNDPETDPTLLGPAFLGQNLDIARRLHDPDWIAYTPTFTNITGGAGSFSYRLRGFKCEVQAAFSAGSVTSTAGVFVGFSLPSAVTASTLVPIMVSNGTQGSLGRVMVTGTVEVYKDPNGGTWTTGNSVAALRTLFAFAIT